MSIFYSPNSLLLGVLNALKNGRLGAGWSGRVLPVLFICLPILFMCLPGWAVVVGFPAGLSVSHFFSQAGRLWSGSRLACLPLPFATSFHLSPTSFHLSPTSFHCLPGWRVAGRLVSHFLSFVSHSFSLVSQFFSLVSQAIHLSPRLVTGGVRPFRCFDAFVSQVCHCFYSFVSQVCRCQCPPFSASHAHFHSSPRSVTAGVRPCQLAWETNE